MKVSELATREVQTCAPAAPASTAAKLMWEGDLGFVPVVEEQTRKVVGVVTDRDLCMAAYTQGRDLGSIPVGRIMSQDVFSCREDDDVRTVHRIMREHRVRRIPVVDARDRIVGIVSLNDLVLDAERSGSAGREHELAKTMAAICCHRVLVPAS